MSFFADIAVTSSPVAGGFAHTVLKSQAYAVLFSREHRFADAPHGLTLEDYVAADQVVVSGDSGLPRLESALRRAGVREVWVEAVARAMW